MPRRRHHGIRAPILWVKSGLTPLTPTVPRPNTGAMGSRANRTLAMVVGGIVVLAVVAAIFSATRPATSFDQATPQGTVQAYLRAVFKGDHEEAARFLDPAGSCDVEDLDRNGTVDSPRVVLRETSTQADSSRVTVRVVRSSEGGPFDTYEATEDHTYRLTRSGGRWVLTGTPWPLYDCEVSVK